jgi:hypothetical protein
MNKYIKKYFISLNHLFRYICYENLFILKDLSLIYKLFFFFLKLYYFVEKKKYFKVLFIFF